MPQPPVNTVTCRKFIVALLALCPSLSAQIEFPTPIVEPAVTPPALQEGGAANQESGTTDLPEFPSHWEGMTGRVVRVWREFESLAVIDSKLISAYLDQLRGYGVTKPRELALHGLDSIHEPTVDLAARLLEFVGDNEDSQSLVDTASAVGSVRIAGTCLDVAMALNSGQLPNGAAKLLSHPKKGVRAAIEKRIKAAPTSNHYGDLLRLIEFGRDADSRLRAVRLMEHFRAEAGAKEALLKALQDSSNAVAFRAVDILGGDGSGESIQNLYELINESSHHQGLAYLLYHLLEIQNQQDDLLITEDMLPLLEESFTSADPFLAGTAAACMGEFLFRSTSIDQFSLGDEVLLHTLVSTVAGTAFYPQFSSFAPVGEKTLSRITGEDLNHLERRAWLAWEVENFDGFIAVRGNLQVSDAELSQMSIRWKYGEQAEHSLVGVDVSTAELLDASEVRILGPMEMRSLLGHLQGLGLLDTRVLPGSFGDPLKPVSASFEITVGQKRKPMVFRGDAGFAWLPDLQSDLQEIYDRHFWQSLAPNSSSQAYVAERLASWDGADEIGKMEFELAITRERISHLSEAQLGKWCDHLLSNPSNSSLWSPQIAAAFLGQLSDHQQDEQLARKLLDCALRSPSPNLASTTLGTLAELPEPLRSELMLSGMRKFEPEVASASLSDERLSVRVAAGRALGSSGAAGREALLRASKDRNPLVVRMAVRSLGELNDPTVVDVIIPFAEPGTLDSLRKEAIIALGKLGDEKAFSVIYKAALDSLDGKLKLAAIQAIAKLDGTRSDEALSALFDDLAKSPLAYDYLQVLESRGFQLSKETYLSGLDSADHRTARTAAIQLGRIGVGDAADVLMEFLPETPHDLNLLQALASCTGADFRDMPDPAGVYAAWWRENGMAESSEWLNRAARNYGMDLSDDFRHDNKVKLALAAPQLIEILLNGPVHLRAMCVWHLSEMCSLDIAVINNSSSQDEVKLVADEFAKWLNNKNE